MAGWAPIECVASVYSRTIMIGRCEGPGEEREGRLVLVRNVDSFSMEERRDPRDPVLLRRIGKPITLLSKYRV